ncbi:hypothetical protein [Citrobacter sedlakii]|uniref:hypothetical protein n=1 Tax=Citrobacter sedlakii TaxID=67826 RepID=UPI0033380E1B
MLSPWTWRYINSIIPAGIIVNARPNLLTPRYDEEYVRGNILNNSPTSCILLSSLTPKYEFALRQVFCSVDYFLLHFGTLNGAGIHRSGDPITGVVNRSAQKKLNNSLQARRFSVVYVDRQARSSNWN